MRSLLITLLVASACGTTPVAPDKTNVSTSLVFSPSQGVDFGTITIGSAAEATVRVLNNGTVQFMGTPGTDKLPAGVTMTRSDCQRFLPARDTCEMTLTFAPAVLGPVSGTLKVSGKTLSIKGTGEAQTPEDNTGPGTAPIVETMEFAQFNAPINFTVEEDDASVTLYAMATGALDPFATDLMITSIITPQGNVIADGANVFSHLNRSNPSTAFTGVTIPQTPDIDFAFTPGDYTFAVIGQDVRTSSLLDGPDVGVELLLVHTKKASSAKRTLNVELYFTGACGLRAANAPSDPGLQAALTKFKTIYREQAGIEVAQVRLYDIGTQFQTVDNSNLTHLYLNAKPGQDALRFFLVSTLAIDNIDGLLGIAGGIPGPFKAPNVSSGIAIQCNEETTAELLGRVFAHEGGHYLGLFHTVEGECLEDDADCVNDNVTDTAGVTKPVSQAELDVAKTNLMFFSAADESPVLSKMQAEVMRRAALVGR